MRTPCAVLPLCLALISASTPAAAFLGWRLWDPITGTPETTSIDSGKLQVPNVLSGRPSLPSRTPKYAMQRY
jgi:hypothetical protein